MLKIVGTSNCLLELLGENIYPTLKSAFLYLLSLFFPFSPPHPLLFSWMHASRSAHMWRSEENYPVGPGEQIQAIRHGSKSFYSPSSYCSNPGTHFYSRILSLILENSISMLLLGYFCSSFASLFTYLFSETESQEPGLRSSLEFAIVLCGHELLVSPAATSQVLGLEVFASTSS